MEQMDGLDVVGCERCDDLCGSRSRIVNGVGPADADLLFVGEAPGANEDEQGEPFVGRSGDVLDAGLRDAGLDRGDVRVGELAQQAHDALHEDNHRHEAHAVGGFRHDAQVVGDGEDGLLRHPRLAGARPRAHERRLREVDAARAGG